MSGRKIIKNRVQNWKQEKLKETAERYRVTPEEVERVYFRMQSNRYPPASGYEFEE